MRSINDRNLTISVYKDISTATTTEIVSAVPSNRIQVMGLSLFTDAANVVTIKSATTAISPTWNFAGASGIGLSQGDDKWFETNINEALNITTSTTGKVAILVRYRLVKV